MSSYYFHAGGEKKGPFSLEELKTQPVKKDSPVWRDGLKNWVSAGDLAELSGVFAPEPPPFVKQQPKLPTSVLIGRTVQVLAGLLLIVMILVFVGGRSGNNPVITPFTDQEKAHPAVYLKTDGTYRPNFWQTKWNIEGSISSFATHTNYKDVVLKVDFYSQTNSVIQEKFYTIYDYFPYGLKKAFAFSVDRPSAAVKMGWQVFGATPY